MRNLPGRRKPDNMVSRAKAQRHNAFLRLAPIITSFLLALAALIGAIAQLVALVTG
jgi:hypothetical protein